jgi:hypothetical protein
LTLPFVRYSASGTSVAPLCHLHAQLVDLAAVQQQLAVAHRLVVLEVALPVGGDVGADQEHLAVSQLGVALADVPPPSRSD